MTVSKRQILTNTIIRCKQEIQEYKSRVTNYERSLYEAEAALKRLNEEEKKKNGGQAVHLPTQKLRKTGRPTEPKMGVEYGDAIAKWWR